MSKTICHCGGAYRVVDSNGVTDPANDDRVEQWECQSCGHSKTEVLVA